MPKKFDSDTLAIEIITSSGPIVLATNYTPPSRGSIPDPALRWMGNVDAPAYLMADLNAHHKSFDHFSDERGEALYRDFLAPGLLNVLGPEMGTWTSPRGKLSKPDLVLSNNKCHHFFLVETLDKNVSDHAPIMLTISSTPIFIPCKQFEQTNKADWQSFSNYIKDNIQPFNLNNCKTLFIDTYIKNITNIILEAKSHSIPTASIRPLNVWKASKKLLRLQKILQNYYNLSAIHINQGNNNINKHIKSKIKDYIQAIKTEAADMQNKYWDTIFKQLNKERISLPAKFWKRIKRILNRGSGMKYLLKNDDGSTIIDPTIIESLFREDSIKKFSPPNDDQIDPEAIISVNNFHRDNPNIRVPHEFIDISKLDPNNPLIKPIKPGEVLGIVEDFKNRAPGPDQIKKIHLMHLPKLIIVLLTKLFNYSLSAGYYPTPFKEGIMIFIPKPGKNLQNPSGYRPITLINIFGKIFGKLLNKRMINHFETSGFYDPMQFGFRRGRGTESALALIYEFIARKKGEGFRVSVISRDVSGAFDRVWHDNLIMLLSFLDLPIIFLKAMASFLTNRSIRIRI